MNDEGFLISIIRLLSLDSLITGALAQEPTWVNCHANLTFA